MSLKTEYSDIHEICRTGWSRFLDEATLDVDYFHRAQHTAEDAERAAKQDRILHTIDKIGRQVYLLSGYEERNRHILKIGPQGSVNQQEDEACSQHTKMIMSLMALSGGYDTLSACFKWGTLVQGSNLLEIWKDRNGDLQFSRLGWNQFLLNPNLSKSDLSDCDDILIGRWLSKDKVKFLVPTGEMPKKEPLTFSERWSHLGTPPLGNKMKLRLYEEWWRRRTEYVDMVISRQTRQEIPLSDFADRFYNGDLRFAKRRINEMRLPDGAPALSRYSMPQNTIKLTIFVDDEEVWDGDNPLKMRDYNFVWFRGDWCPEYPRDELKLQSFTRRLRDPQDARNRRFNQIMDLLESQIQGLRIVRSDKLINPEDAHKAGQGITLHIDSEKDDGQTPLKEIFTQTTGAEVPQGMFAALELIDRDETDVGGLNQEIFGSDDKDIPGILHRFRTGQALTGQQGMFSSFVAGKREFGRKTARAVQLNYPPNKIFQLINEWPTAGFYEHNLTKYDCTPVEGLHTDSQQQLFYLELKNLRMMFPDEASLIPLSVMVRFSPTPFKKELLQIIQQSEQKQQQMQQQAMQDKARMDKWIEAQAAEEVAQAEENRTGAALDRAKTIAEFQDITAKPYLDAMKLAVAAEKNRIMAKTKEKEKVKK